MRPLPISTFMKVATATVIVGGIGWTVVAASRRPSLDRPADSAPGRTARRSSFGDYIVSGRTVTVNATRDALYNMWRDIRNLPRLLDDVREANETAPNRWAWVLQGPVGREAKIEVDLTEDRPGEVLAWNSVEGSEIEARGKLAFSDAPGGRGTQVEAIISYKPMLGQAGHWLAKLSGRDPTTLARHSLKRMKMLAETGEIATAANRKEA